MLDTGQLALSGEALMWFRQGLTASSANDYGQAVLYFDRVLEIHDTCYEVWYERGLALENRGDYIEAIASYDRALSLCPESQVACEIWHDRGNAYQYGLGDYRQAIFCYDQALKVDPHHEMVWQSRGNAILYGLSRPEDALDCYNRAIAANPDNALAWRNRGNALVELRRFEEAIASYDRALAISPDDQISWHARSLAAEKSGMGHHLPTTNPAWYGSGYGDQTFLEGDTDSNIIFASRYTAINEVNALPQGQPLLVLEDDWGRREILLERDRYVIGRDPNCDICLHSQFVSRYHATLRRVDNQDGSFGYHMVDGSEDGKPSTNGLLINGQKCQSMDLQAEDVIVFGPRVRATYHLLPVFRNQSG